MDQFQTEEALYTVRWACARLAVGDLLQRIQLAWAKGVFFHICNMAPAREIPNRPLVSERLDLCGRKTDARGLACLIFPCHGQRIQTRAHGFHGVGLAAKSRL